MGGRPTVLPADVKLAGLEKLVDVLRPVGELLDGPGEGVLDLVEAAGAAPGFRIRRGSWISHRHYDKLKMVQVLSANRPYQ